MRQARVSRLGRHLAARSFVERRFPDCGLVWGLLGDER